ncbi:MAG TPA: NAD(P)/FAD-dependent oxidoreductase [Bacillota bacterium]|nr:NAD(P)/FAD-dependent oxidoreductase [Bacillota bacterium]
MINWDVVVVGGGPAGSAAAAEIAKQGFKVLVVEDNPIIGEPVQCAGLVSPRVVEWAACEELVLNRFSGARVYSPKKASLDLAGGRIYAKAIDRAGLDQLLAARAQEAGAEFILGAKAIGFSRIPGGIQVELARSGGHGYPTSAITRVTARLLIGADGVNSAVAKWAELNTPVEIIPMFAAEVELTNQCPDLIELFLGSAFAPGWFGWIIPLSPTTARIGTGSSVRKRPLKELLNRLIEQYPARFRGMHITKLNSGLVPIGKRRVSTANVLLLGDAACQTKPISGGGLYMIMRASPICADVAVASLKQEDQSAVFLARYQERWDQETGKEVDDALKLRRLFLSLSDRQMALTTALLNRKAAKNLILDYADIDYPYLLAKKLPIPEY